MFPIFDLSCYLVIGVGSGAPVYSSEIPAQKTLALAFASRAIGSEVIVSTTNAALHNVSVSVSGVLLASMSFSSGVLAVSLSFSLEIGLNIIIGEEESPSSAFALASPLLLEASAKVSAELSYRFSGESPPGSPGISESIVDSLCCFWFRHV